ncbi:glycoside hydrolase [Empedobacter falsenii]
MKLKSKIRVFITLCISVISTSFLVNPVSENAEIVSTSMIWDSAPHNAFTTLESYKGYMYCSFREASSHRAYDGKIRIIRSNDGKNWESVALINQANEDLRDPKLVLLDNSLVLLVVSRTNSKHYSYTYSSNDGKNWNFMQKSNNTWRWNATNTVLNNSIYSVGYSGDDKSGKLYQTKNARDWVAIKNNFFPNVNNQPSETKIFILPNQKLVALVRQEKGNQNAVLGISNPPYSNWTWKDLGVRIGGPSGIAISNDEILACVRLYNKPVRLSLLRININNATYKEIATLPSGGDTGYSDITEFNGEYYVSYYSSKNKANKASIYLSHITLN